MKTDNTEELLAESLERLVEFKSLNNELMITGELQKRGNIPTVFSKVNKKYFEKLECVCLEIERIIDPWKKINFSSTKRFKKSIKTAIQCLKSCLKYLGYLESLRILEHGVIGYIMPFGDNEREVANIDLQRLPYWLGCVYSQGQEIIKK